MKKWTPVFITALLVALAFAVSTHSVDAVVKTNSPAPDFSLQDSLGQTHALSDFKGKYVVLEWVNFDCPFVKKHYNSGNMQQLQKELTADGAVWLSINSSAPGNQGNFSVEEINQRIQDLGAAQTAYLIDESGEVGKLYAAQTTPHIYLINPEGNLIYQGAIDSIPGVDPEEIADATNYLTQAYQSAQAGAAVPVGQTKSYGCSVKY